MKMTSQLLLSLALLLCVQNVKGQTDEIDFNVLIGTWTIDMSPQDKTDSNFAMMKITKVKDNTFKGTFYRKGVAIRNAKLNTQQGVIYGALVSGDGTGEYNTTFYFKDGMLHGTTHAIKRDFLAIWTATKNQ